MVTLDTLRPRPRRRTLSGMLAAIAARADAPRLARSRRSVTPDRLILDAFRVREHTAAPPEDLYEVVSRRYRRRSLILATNRDPNDLYALFPTPVLAEGLLDRLLDSAEV